MIHAPKLQSNMAVLVAEPRTHSEGEDEAQKNAPKSGEAGGGKRGDSGNGIDPTVPTPTPTPLQGLA